LPPCQILRIKCTKFYFGWGSVPDPTGGAYSAPQTSYLDLRGLGLLLRVVEGGGEDGRGREGNGGKGGKEMPSSTT